MASITIVGGCGHVGLPLGLAFASKGHSVTAYDISAESVSLVNLGKMPFMEEGAPELLCKVIESKSFTATSDPSCLSKAEVIVVVIGTPVDEHLSPDPNSVVDSVLDLKPYFKANQLILLRSTIFPGVTSRIEEKLTAEIPGIHIAYCPERIVEGQALVELETLPQIIGCRTQEVFERASNIFSYLSIKTLQTTPEEAELAKLFTNVWRYIKFATANQFWMMANDMGVDYDKVRKAISFEYPRAADLPKAGFTAGPCLFKDTMQLSALVQQNFPLGHSAMMVNEGLPGYLVSRLSEIYDLRNMTIGILGMTFKANIDDTRNSLAFKLRKLLSFRTQAVLITDPFAKDSRLIPFHEVIKNADLLIIGAPHTQYESIATEKPIIDIWGLLNKGVLI